MTHYIRCIISRCRRPLLSLHSCVQLRSKGFDSGKFVQDATCGVLLLYRLQCCNPDADSEMQRLAGILTKRELLRKTLKICPGSFGGTGWLYRTVHNKCTVLSMKFIKLDMEGTRAQCLE